MKINEDNYIQQLMLRNEDALMYIIDEYGGLLMSVIRKHLFGVPHRQEECFNDVLLKIWENISCYDKSKNTFKNWIAAIARYRAVDYLRQYERELKTENIDDTVIVGDDKMLAQIIEEEASREIEELLECLKPVDRELFIKLYVDEKSVDQVSVESGMKKEVIYNRVSRGKQKLRRQLSTGRGV